MYVYGNNGYKQLMITDITEPIKFETLEGYYRTVWVRNRNDVAINIPIVFKDGKYFNYYHVMEGRKQNGKK